jgi:DNA polymerase-1
MATQEQVAPVLPEAPRLTRLIADLECNGFLEAVTKIHCLVTHDVATGEVVRYNDQQGPTVHPAFPIKDALPKLLAADQVIGHNLIKFDYPVLQKIYPDFKPDMSKVLDTLVMSRLIYADIGTADTKLIKAGKLPGNMWGAHSLEAWGHRLKKHKGDYSKDMKAKGLDPWAAWNEDMEDYCVGDTEVTYELLKKLESKNYPQQVIELEHQVAVIVARQERYGFKFDIAKAAALYVELVQKKQEASDTVTKVFKPRYMRDGAPMTPKRDNAKMGYVAGAPFQKLKLTEFNPGSRDHIAFWLKALYQWEPTEFTDDGKPKIDETTLTHMKYAEIQPLRDYLMLDKRCGQISEGKQAWLKKEKNGRIHGSVNTCGAVTGRMTHSSPNMAQVPASYSPYGHECRDLFCVSQGKKLVGADAAALELRDLAGYMVPYDNGEYAKVVLEGDKDQGTDIHSVNARALGLEPKSKYLNGVCTGPDPKKERDEPTGRDIAKTWFYAWAYGSGDENLGFILTGKKGEFAKQLGTRARASFLRALPAMAELVKRVKAKAKEAGFLRGLDGRILTVRSQHSALNTLLQSAGAVQMKQALVFADQEYQRRGWIPGVHYEFVANVHDEAQIEADEGIAEEIGKIFVESIRKAGEHFKFKCPLDGEYQVGNTWAETH